MSQENVEILRQALRAVERRDVEAWVECFTPDVELLLPRNLIEGGSYEGHDGVRQALADVVDTWASVRFYVKSIRAVDALLLALCRTVNVGKEGAPAIEYESAYLARISSGKIRYFRPYQSHLEALEAAGLSE